MNVSSFNCSDYHTSAQSQWADTDTNVLFYIAIHVLCHPAVSGKRFTDLTFTLTLPLYEIVSFHSSLNVSPLPLTALLEVGGQTSGALLTDTLAVI